MSVEDNPPITCRDIEFIPMDIYTAASVGNEFVIQNILEKDLLKKSSILDRGNISGWTPLMYAAQTGSHRIVLYLLKEGASVGIRNEDGLTALMLACLYAHVDSAALLIDFGADVDAADKKGWTALFLAASAGHSGVVHLLLEKKCLVNITDVKGMSPLMHAAASGHVMIVEALLQYGADVFITSKAKETALSLATVNKHANVRTTIESHIFLKQNYFPMMEMVPNIGSYNSSMEAVLGNLGLTKYYPIFQEHEIDLNAFWALTDQDLLGMGIKLLGPRRKLTNEIAKWQKMLKVPNEDGQEYINKIVNLNHKLQRRITELEHKMTIKDYSQGTQGFNNFRKRTRPNGELRCLTRIELRLRTLRPECTALSN